MTCSAPTMSRVFLHIGPLTIYWYGVIIACGALLGLYLASREANKLGMKKDMIIDFIVFAIPAAIICARIYYVIFEWDQYKGGPWWNVFAIWNGGIAIHGAIIGSIITAIIFTKVRHISFWKLADIVAPSLILGQAIGRWGNFMNQEAHGGAVSEAFYNHYLTHLPDFITNQMCIGGIMYHPTFLYESLWDILVFILLLVLRKYNPARGELFLTYGIAYSIGRFFIEGMRMDSLYVDGLRTAQIISIVIVVIAVGLIIFRRKSGMVKYRYNDDKIKRTK